MMLDTIITLKRINNADWYDYCVNFMTNFMCAC